MINIKNGLLILCTKHRCTDLMNELQLPGGRVGGIVREFGMDRYTLLYLKWITNKDLLWSTGNSAQCYVLVWVGGEFGGEWTHAYL